MLNQKKLSIMKQFKSYFNAIGTIEETKLDDFTLDQLQEVSNRLGNYLDFINSQIKMYEFAQELKTIQDKYNADVKALKKKHNISEEK